MDDLSPGEQDLAAELSKLTSDPSPASREAIMGAVRTATRRTAQTPRLTRAWRLTAAALVAVAMVLATTVFAFAASSAALPDSPAYGLRSAGERVRLAIVGGTDRELLRITFAREHFRQAKDVVHRNRPEAVQLLSDGREYLTEAKSELQSLPAGEQGQIQNQLNQAQQEQSQTENQVGQQGQH
jgi:hypothetical protein